MQSGVGLHPGGRAVIVQPPMSKDHAEFAAKLRLSAAALGCTSRKAFCAKFHAVNPRTQCEVERLHKWMQGRAVPRGLGFYEDWRLVIGSSRPAAWLEASSLEDFAEELARATGCGLDELRQRERRQARGGDAQATVFGAQSTPYGAFACYSHAWSPRFWGKLIRGSLRITPSHAAGVQVEYAEALINGAIRLSGEAVLSGGMLHVLLRQHAAGPPLFLSVIVPGPPANALCGILAGPTFISHTAAPTATRLVAVRVPERPGLDASNRYLEASADAVMDNLGQAGLPLEDADRVGAGLLEFLGAGANQVGLVDQLLICDLLDAAHASAAGG